MSVGYGSAVTLPEPGEVSASKPDIPRPFTWSDTLNSSINTCINQGSLTDVVGVNMNRDEREDGMSSLQLLDESIFVGVIDLNGGDSLFSKF
jgi:hypothetical protein